MAFLIGFLGAALAIALIADLLNRDSRYGAVFYTLLVLLVLVIAGIIAGYRSPEYTMFGVGIFSLLQAERIIRKK